MDQAILRRTNARNIPYAQKVPVKGLTDKQIKYINRIGGLGERRDRNGKIAGGVHVQYDAEEKRKKIVQYMIEDRKKPRNTYTKEYEAWLESIFEREVSGRHPMVKPSEVKQKKKSYDTWVEGDRPIQGVDV